MLRYPQLAEADAALPAASHRPALVPRRDARALPEDSPQATRLRSGTATPGQPWALVRYFARALAAHGDALE
jgi:hypothetical protein